MINLYIGDFNYDSSYRSFLVDILKPIIPEKNLEKYQLSKFSFSIVNKSEECDYFLLPYSWNYYIKTDNLSVAKLFIREAHKFKKKILIWVTGDYYYSLPQNKNIIEFYTSPYKSIQKVNTIALPVIINDPLSFLNLECINNKPYKNIPTVGFCGHVDSNLIISIFKMVNLAWQNIKYLLRIIPNYSGPLISPTTMRKNILDTLEGSNSIQTEYIRRNKYQGGKSKNTEEFSSLRKEFYQNINNSDYTLCIRGTGNFSTRFYETLAMGRIPIFINTDCILPLENEINWKEHVLWIEKTEIPEISNKILEFHKSMNNDSFIDIQNKNRKLWEKYFSFPGYVNSLVHSLEEKMSR